MSRPDDPSEILARLLVVALLPFLQDDQVHVEPGDSTVNSHPLPYPSPRGGDNLCPNPPPGEGTIFALPRPQGRGRCLL
jgi:hypothetical protein